MKKHLTVSLVPRRDEAIRIWLAMSLLLFGLMAIAQNAAPSAITLNSTSIFENSAYGSEVGAFQTTDADALDNHSYSLVAGGGDIDNDQFYITVSGILRTKAVFDYESINSYSIRVRTDDGNGGQYDETFDISVEDAAESPTNITLDPNGIPENNAIGDVIGTLTAADEDAGETYTFSFTQSENYPSNTSFSILGNELKAAQTFDYESKGLYVIRVQVQDSRGGYYQRSLNIAIGNVVVENNSPTNIDLSPRTIDEENAIGDVIGTLSTTDADAEDTHTYSMEAGVVDNDQFTLTGSQLKAGAIFDFETKSSYVVQIKTDDGNGGLYVKNITVLIGNVAESGPPTSTVLSSYSIEENNDLFDPVGTFSSVDPDAGDTFSYSLIAGAGDTGNSSFRIVGNELQANTAFDYETTNSYSILVRTTDSQGNSIDGNFTITIEDLNDVATLDFELNNNTINENVANGTLVGTLTPINATVPASVNFQFAAGDGDTDNALFNRSGRDISFNGVPNYETKRTYSIRVEADDQGDLVEKVLLIQVNDVNEAPTFVNVSATTIQENNAIGQVVAVLSTDDPDEGDTFTYFFASPEPQFTIDGNLIKANETFNFERVPPINYNVTIRSRDAGFQFSPDRMVSFVVTNQNEAPTDVSLSATSILENVSVGGVVGTATTTDEDDGDSFTYSIVSGFGDEDKFEFSGDQLLTTELFNYEERSVYNIRVQTEDTGGLQYVKDFSINILNAGESPFDIDLTNASIDENNEVGDVIGLLSASDPDASDTFTFYVLNSPADGFSFDIANGNELVADEAFDFEDQSSYTINIQVRDQTNRPYTEEYTITINDINENQAPSALSLSNSTIDEGNSIGDAIGSFTTTDADADDTFSYSFVSGEGGEDNASFSIIDGNELVANAVFDYETKNSFDIQVRTDDGNGGTFDETFTITIGDVAENNAPTDILLSAIIIDENNSVNAVIGTLTTTDSDEGDSHIYSLVSNPDNAFNILNDQLRASESFDFETQETYDIRIQTDDQNGGTFEEDFTITINDITENSTPTDIALTPTDIDENNEINDIIGTLGTTDADGDDTHVYSLVTNPGGSFNILDNQLRASVIFDFEAQSSYEIRIQTDDQNGGTFEEDFTITVNDVNDLPTEISLSASAIDENNAVNAVIGNLSTTDDDEDSHVYTLVINPGNAFNILNNQLRAIESFDFESVESYDIRIEADDQNGGTVEEDFTITVNNVEDNSAPSDVVLSASAIDENNEIGDLVGSLSTTDEDAGDSHTYTLVSNPGFYFRIVEDRLEANAFFNFENTDSYDITISTSDGDASFQKDFTISIINVNDVPTSIGLTNASISENNEVGDLIGFLGTSDQDLEDIHTYTLEINPGNAFAINGKRLEANTVFDFGSQSSFDIRVRSSDGNGGQLDRDFTITINAEVDEQGPEIVEFTPVNGTTGILQSQDLVVTFNEPIALGNGLIKVIRAGGSGQEVISSVANGGDDVISISGSQLTIHLDGDDRKRDLFFGSEYYVNIPSTAVLDASNNQLENPIVDQTTWTFFAEKEDVNLVFEAIADKYTNDQPFDVSATTNNVQASVEYSILSGPATISGNTITLTGATGTVNVQASQPATQRFKAVNISASFEVTNVPDTEAPEIVSFTPEDQAVDVPLDGDLVVLFDEPIAVGTADILVRIVSGGSYALSGNTTDNPDIFEISGSTLIIKMANANNFGFTYNQTYYVTINSGAVKDLAGNNFTSAITNNTDWNFTTEKRTVTWDGDAWSNGSGSTSATNAVIDGDYSMSTDGFFAAANLTITAGNTVIVSGNRTLDVRGDLTIDGDLIVASGSSILTYDGNSIDDNVTIQRNTRYADGKYSFVGTPVEENASITGADLGAHIYKYDEGASADVNDLARWQSATLDVLAPGRGYTQANQKLIEFVGRPNDGMITYGGSHSQDGWHLVSNPYPAALDLSAFLDANTNTTDAIYLWDDNGSEAARGTSNDYIIVNKTAATDNSGENNESRWNGYIGSMQGFFIQMDGAPGDIVFDENMRVIGSNNDISFFRKRVSDLPVARINLTSSYGLFEQTVIGWNEVVSDDELSEGYDARVFSTSADYLIYTTKANIPLAIQTVTSGKEVMPLGYQVAEAGNYTLGMDVSKAQGKTLYLHDLHAGRVTDLGVGAYDFSSAAGVFADRFELRTTGALLSNSVVQKGLYVKDKMLYITVSQPARYELLNLSGQRLTTALVNEAAVLDLNHLANGVYLINDGLETIKIILK